MEEKRWNLLEEVNKLIDEALDLSFPGLGEKSQIIMCKEEYGDYHCENVLSIWPKLLEDGTELEGPKSVGMAIKKELEKRCDMIEGTPCVRTFGFVTFKLSGNWMAKRLHNMVRCGIDTWAPELPFKGVIVEIPDYESSIWNRIVGSEADIIRSNFIRETLIRMLEYSKVFVKCNKDEFLKNALSHVPDDILSFSIEERDGDAVISNVEGKLESLNFGKRKIRDVKDSLKILWYELKDETADWIVSLNPLRHQEYVEKLFTAAKHAGWIPTPKHHKLSFAGYQTHAEAGKLVYLLENALIRCNSLVKQGKVPEYTAERVFCCALGYDYLKKSRMLDCTFDVDEMLNEKGNTFLYVLNTKSQVLSVLANSGKDVKLKNVSELTLEKDKGRALGFHLLSFTQCLLECCLSVLPHLLCGYLYELCQKFTSYNSSYSSEVGSVAETIRLVLCEATAAVLEKCFHLLGITPVSIFEESFIEPLKLLSDLKRRMGPKDLFISCYDSVITSLARDPPKHARFEISAIRPLLTKLKRGKLFGRILVHDKHGIVSDAWLPTINPDYGMASLFMREWYDPVEMVDHGLVTMGNPDARHSIPVSTSSIQIRVELIATNETEDAYDHFENATKKLELANFGDIEDGGVCGTILLEGEGMEVLMYGILLKDAVDAVVEGTFKVGDVPCKVEGCMYAYYGKKFPYVDDGVTKSNYLVELLEPSIMTAGPLQLNRSMIAVPKDGSLVIEAKFIDADSRKVLFHVCHEFPTRIGGDSKRSIRGKKGVCSLDLIVNWKYA